MRRRSAPASAIVLPGVWKAISTTKTLIAKCVASLDASDAGYFGPGSVSWRIYSHASYGVSGVAAVLMQACHPTAMAVVDRRSAFRSDAWRRAHMTTDYIFSITFSSHRAADAAAKKVRHIHRGVSGIDPVTGRVQRADEPALLLWIHAIHTEYALRGYETFVQRLTPGDADRFVAEQVVAARLVGLDRQAVPATRAALRAFIASVEGLGVDRPAREFATMLMRARMPNDAAFLGAPHCRGRLAAARGSPARLRSPALAPPRASESRIDRRRLLVDQLRIPAVSACTGCPVETSADRARGQTPNRRYLDRSPCDGSFC